MCVKHKVCKPTNTLGTTKYPKTKARESGKKKNTKCKSNGNHHTLNHVGNSLAGKIEERANVEVVGSEDELKESSLVNLAELQVPRRNVVGALLVLLLLRDRCGVLEVILAVGDDLLENLAGDVRERDSLVRTDI